MSLPRCQVWRPGRMAYPEALALQNRLAEARGRGGDDQLLLLEHPHTYTFGSSGQDEHLLLTPAQLAQRGITVFRADRGGDITYHGPGQLVGYPILSLASDAERLRVNVIGYVRKLEMVIIRTLSDDGIRARAIPGLTGVWVDSPAGEAKIAAIGVRVTVRAVTKHGFALNLDPDLSCFDGIVPCGLHDKRVTSLAALLGAPVDEEAITRRLAAHFGAVFEREVVLNAAQVMP